jgi:pilus assembly protein FimV
MAKLCEIYFVWGNRDAFIDAATHLHDQLGGESSPDWDKIVIMGQQISGDHRLFSGVSAAAASRDIDLSFDSEDGADALDLDFASGPDGEVSDIVDLGGDQEAASANDSGLDFIFDDEPATGATTTREMPNRSAEDESTVESPTVQAAAADSTIESPTIERPLEDVDGTSELPSISASDDDAERWGGDATAEIDLADLGLDLEALAKAGLDEDLDDGDEDAIDLDLSDLDQTSENKALQPDLEVDVTGRNPALDDEDESSSTGLHERFDAAEDEGATSEMPALEEVTGKNPAVSELDEAGELGSTDVDIDFDIGLLDATGQTQILSGDFTSGDAAAPLEDDEKTVQSPAFDDDAETLLASTEGVDGDADDEPYQATAALNAADVDVDFDFAKTEALPKDTFSKDDADDTAQVPVGSTDLDVDLDDLTSALRFSEGDTVDQPRDDATVEQPLASGVGKDHQFIDLDFGEPIGTGDDAPTEALSPDEFSDDLHDARTMTEVGTKLDLARAYVDMGDPDGARSILEEVLDEGDDGQRQQAKQLIDTLPA